MRRNGRKEHKTQMKVAFDSQLRALLDAEAQKNDRSVAEEIRRRLWESFGGQVGCVYTQAWLDQVKQ